MRIACLQFAPVLGDVGGNLLRADGILERTDATGLDLLTLPELAFSGETSTMILLTMRLTPM